MTTLRVVVDRYRCIGSGNCVFWAPATFELDEEGLSVPAVPAGDASRQLQVAAEGCPTRAITVEVRPADAGARPGPGERVGRACRSPLSGEHQELRRSVAKWLVADSWDGSRPGRCSTPRSRSSGPCGPPWPRQGWLGDPPARGLRGPGIRTVRAGGDPGGDGSGP